jgi:hypothetical protein
MIDCHISSALVWVSGLTRVQAYVVQPCLSACVVQMYSTGRWSMTVKVEIVWVCADGPRVTMDE